jgi:hypothetical protein
LIWLRASSRSIAAAGGGLVPASYTVRTPLTGCFRIVLGEALWNETRDVAVDVLMMSAGVMDTREMSRRSVRGGNYAGRVDALCEFFTTLSAISHNPLLAAVSKAINEIQIGMALELSGGARGGFGRVAGPMYQARIDIVDAIARRDAADAAECVREYHRRVIERTGDLPRAKRLAKTDPGLSASGQQRQHRIPARRQR